MEKQKRDYLQKYSILTSQKLCPHMDSVRKARRFSSHGGRISSWSNSPTIRWAPGLVEVGGRKSKAKGTPLGFDPRRSSSRTGRNLADGGQFGSCSWTAVFRRTAGNGKRQNGVISSRGSSWCRHLEQANVVAVEFDSWRGFEGAAAAVFFCSDEKKNAEGVRIFTQKDGQFDNC